MSSSEIVGDKIYVENDQAHAPTKGQFLFYLKVEFIPPSSGSPVVGHSKWAAIAGTLSCSGLIYPLCVGRPEQAPVRVCLMGNSVIKCVYREILRTIIMAVTFNGA